MKSLPIANCRLPIEIIANCQLPIADWHLLAGRSDALNQQLAIGNWQCSYVAA
jgi:hypothetical protein